MGKRPKLTKRQIEELKRLYRAGVSVKEICTRFGISHTTLYKYLRDRGKVSSIIPVMKRGLWGRLTPASLCSRV